MTLFNHHYYMLIRCKIQLTLYKLYVNILYSDVFQLHYITVYCICQYVFLPNGNPDNGPNPSKQDRCSIRVGQFLALFCKKIKALSDLKNIDLGVSFFEFVVRLS